jgi:DNA-binding IclR family transcriptional regulator
MVPLHCTAHGKALLSGLDHEGLRRIFGSGPLPIHTKRTIGTLTELAAACAEIQQQGYATDEAQFREGLRCVAAPIRAKRGMIVGSIGGNLRTTRHGAGRRVIRALLSRTE